MTQPNLHPRTGTAVQALKPNSPAFGYSVLRIGPIMVNPGILLHEFQFMFCGFNWLFEGFHRFSLLFSISSIETVEYYSKKNYPF